MDNATVLCVEHLCTSFFTQNGEIKAVNDVPISVPRGRIVGIVGESGCGKSMTARSIMRLLHYPGRIVSGSIKLAGTELLELSEHEMSAVRGEEIGMILQEPMTSLNPVMRVDFKCVKRCCCIVRYRRRRQRQRFCAYSARSAYPNRNGGITVIRMSYPAGCARE